MSVHVTMQEPVVVDVAPVNESTKKWGVCAVPRMWQMPDGSFILRVNGEQDTCFVDNLNQARNQYYLSNDLGDTWEHIPDGDSVVDMRVITGIEPPYIRLQNGNWAAIRRTIEPAAISNIPYLKTYPRPSLETISHSYRYADLPEEYKSADFVIYDHTGKEVSVCPLHLDAPELEVDVLCGAQYRDGKEILVKEYVPIPERLSRYTHLHSIVELKDGTLAGLVYGQNPDVPDRTYGIVYFAVSHDGGHTWTIRGTIGIRDTDVDFGYTEENSLAIAPDGSLLVVMRTEHCVPKEVERMTGTMYSRSADNGFTWTKPAAITDSSVTPHLVTLENGVIAFVYGRPGVHVRYSTDNGISWSEPHTVIGKTLEEFTAEGVEYMDCKYWNQDSYCNTFMFPISEDTVLLCYNDMKYDPGDGLEHRASLVRKIKFEKF